MGVFQRAVRRDHLNCNGSRAFTREDWNVRLIKLHTAALVALAAALVPSAVDRPTQGALSDDAPTVVNAPSTVATGEATPPAADPTPAPPESRAAPRVAPRDAAPAAPGMIAAIDPATGRIGPPSAAQRAAAERARVASALGPAFALDRSGDDLEIVRLPDGAEMVRLNGRFMEHVVARVDASGRIVTDCAQGPDVADRLTRDPSAVRVEE